MLLGEFWQAAGQQRGLPLVAAVPCRGEILFTDSRMQQVATLRQAAGADASATSRRLSDALFLRRGDRWEAIDPDDLWRAEASIAGEERLDLWIEREADDTVLQARLPRYLPKGTPAPEPPNQSRLVVQVICNKPPDERPAEPPRPEGSRPPPHYPVRRTNHSVHWRVDQTEVADAPALQRELLRRIADKSLWWLPPDADELAPPALVIEPLPGTYYDDVARTVDAAKAAGFEQINFGGGLGSSK